LTVSIDAQGQIFLQDQAVELSDIVPKLQAIAQNNPERRIFVRGDKDLAYGRIMEVMGTITQGGFTKVALLAEQTAGQPASDGKPADSKPPTPSHPELSHPRKPRRRRRPLVPTAGRRPADRPSRASTGSAQHRQAPYAAGDDGPAAAAVGDRLGDRACRRSADPAVRPAAYQARGDSPGNLGRDGVRRQRAI